MAVAGLGQIPRISTLEKEEELSPDGGHTILNPQTSILNCLNCYAPRVPGPRARRKMVLGTEDKGTSPSLLPLVIACGVLLRVWRDVGGSRDC